jgi:hypothetical protein
MACDHISKVVQDGYKLIDGQMHSIVLLWGCTKCDITSSEQLYDITENFIQKKACETDCDCFGCKAKGLQLSTGDANGRAAMPRRKWEGELQAYRDARRQGIQPAGTTMEKIVAAEKASENLGRAYNAEKDPNAKQIDKKTAKVMTELGA